MFVMHLSHWGSCARLLSKEQAAREKDLTVLPGIRADLLALGKLAPEDVRGPVAKLEVERSHDSRLQERLGPRPTSARTRALWDRAADLIDNYRKYWNLTDADNLLGPLPPTDTPQAADRASLERQLERLERMLDRAGRSDMSRST